MIFGEKLLEVNRRLLLAAARCLSAASLHAAYGRGGAALLASERAWACGISMDFTEQKSWDHGHMGT